MVDTEKHRDRPSGLLKYGGSKRTTLVYYHGEDFPINPNLYPSVVVDVTGRE